MGEIKNYFGSNLVKKINGRKKSEKISDDVRVSEFCVTNLTIEMNEKKEKKKCSSSNNEKISYDARLSEFCVTNLTIEMNE